MKGNVQDIENIAVKNGYLRQVVGQKKNWTAI
jgi:hypothetical protein